MKKDFATFLTYSGIEIDIQNVKEEDINVNDIFHSLSMVNRFTGHSNRPLSVAEHSVYCYIIAKKLNLGSRIEFLTLMHDSSEAYINDMPTYIKNILPEYKEIENEIERIIFNKIGLNHMTDEEKSIVKKIDNTIILIEMRDLTQHDIHKMDLVNRDNFYEDVKNVIDLKLGDIKILLDENLYELATEENYQRKFEKLMKQIYKTMKRRDKCE